MIDDSRQALCSADELAAALAAGQRPVLLDVRWQVGGPAQYEAYCGGHLPGAQFCDLDAALAAPPGAAGRHPLPEPSELQEAMRSWGIDDASEVVVYDGGSSVAAARAWWVLRWAGLDRVTVLDGGLAGWLAGGHPVQTEIERPVPGAVTVRAGSLPALDADTAADWARDGRLVDVRAPERFRGEIEPLDPVAGRIPGAVNLPATDNSQPTGEFLAPERLRERFAALTSQAPIGVYCGSGVTAAHTVLALHSVGIYAVLYPGSWSEWITDPNRPVATG